MKQKMKLFEARYYPTGEGTIDSFLFVSDGMREPMEKEAANAYRKMVGIKGSEDVHIEDVYRIDDVHDYTGKKNYKIILKAV